MNNNHNNTEFIKRLAFEVTKYNKQKKSTRVTPVKAQDNNSIIYVIGTELNLKRGY